MRKPRPIPEFARLTPTQKDQLYSWFERGFTYDQLVAMAAQPAPAGFGLKISRDKMYRYYHGWQEIRDLYREDHSITVEAYHAVLNGDPVQISAEARLRIKAQAFAMTLHQQQDPAQLLNLLKVFDFERAQDIANRRLKHKESAAMLSLRRQQFREQSAA